MSELKELEKLKELESKITETVIATLTPTIMQVIDQVQNSVVRTESMLNEATKMFENNMELQIKRAIDRLTPKHHLWIIYPLIGVLFSICAYIYKKDRVSAERNTMLTNEIGVLIEQLQRDSIDMDETYIYQIDDSGVRKRIGVRISFD